LTKLTNGEPVCNIGAVKVLNLYAAKTQLSSLVEEAAAGQEIVIAKAGVPRARLVAARAAARRRPGGSKGRIRIAADFDAPLPPEILAGFTGLPARRTRKKNPAASKNSRRRRRH
jgi:prevent-host-death family protein